MQTEMIVALVAAGSALSVSLLTGILQILQTRATRRTEAEVRAQQHSNDIATKRSEEKQHALREACKALQRIQDEILFMIKSYTGFSHSGFIVSKTHQNRLSEAVEDLLNAYREYHAILSDQDRKNLNKARKKAVDMMIGIQLEDACPQETQLTDRNYVKELEAVSMSIGHYHQQLLFSAVTELQSLLVKKKESTNGG